ncbi:hypothetical protein BH18ACI2_BH18ACI2_11270 [soil metagenome]
MNEEHEQDTTFNEDQQQMFGVAEENQAPDATRARTPGADSPPTPDVSVQPPTGAGNEQSGDESSLLPHITATRAPGGTEISGGTDKYGPGGLADSNNPTNATDAGFRETGDISGATSTHKGAGGDMSNTGGGGTAPTK